jgi:hypothetical protein
MHTWAVPAKFSFIGFLELYATLISTGASTHVERYLPVALLWLALVAALTVIAYRRFSDSELKGFAVPFLAAWILIPPLGIYAIYALPHVFYSPKPEARYLLMSLPPFILLLAWGVSSLRKQTAELALVALAVTSSLFFLRGYFRQRWLQDDFISISAVLKEDRLTDEGVLLHTDKDWPVFAAHYDGSFFGVPSGQDISEGWVDRFLRSLWSRNGGIWLVQTPDSLRADPHGLVRGWFDRHGEKVASFQVGRRVLTLYRRTPRPPATESCELVKLSLRRARVGEPAAVVLCAHAADRQRVRVLIDRKVWTEGTCCGNLRCGLVPVVFPADVGRHNVRVEMGGRSFDLGNVSVHGRNVAAQAEASGLNRTSYEWEGGILLLGYKVDNPHLHPGDYLQITTLWKVNGATTQPKTLFVHLIGKVYNASQGNFLWGQKDSEPLGGKLPSTAWTPGEEWIENWQVPVLPNAPTGTYQIEIGWYDPVTGARLKLLSPSETAGRDSAILGSVEVRK